MITKEELNSIEDKKTRFEVAMLYMLLHGMFPCVKDLSFEMALRIVNTMTAIKERMNPDSIKDGCEYSMVEAGDYTFNAIEEMNKRAFEKAEKEANYADACNEEKVYHWDGNDTCHYEDIMEILRGLQCNEKYSQKAITADIDWLHHISTTIKNNN